MTWFTSSILGLLCLSGLAQADQRLNLTGSSTVAPVVMEIAKRFEANNPDVRIDVQTGGPTRCYRHLYWS